MTPGEIDSVFLKLNTGLRKFKEEFGVEFLSRVKQRTPTITGHLQNSWGKTNTKDDIEIYNTAEYASFVENGTDKMAPRGMLATTLLEKDDIARVAKQRSGLK